MSIKSDMSMDIQNIEPEKLEALPDIELYMDQLIEYLARTPMSMRRDDKLTGAMVNNYIKSGLLPRANGKRYSKEHLADLAMIVRLKQVLSVADTGALLKMAREDDSSYYDHFCDIVHEELEEISRKILNYEGSTQSLAMRLAVESYVCRIACEELITSMGEDKN